MKTSNRILLIFFINIFLIPLCLFMGYSTLIRKGQYTLMENHGRGGHSGTIKAAHTVKLLASERELICNVTYADSFYYDYDAPMLSDSMAIYSVADTIFIKYTGKYKKEDDAIWAPLPIVVDLKLSQLSNLIIEQGRVNILSLDTSQAQTVVADVYGSGILNLGEGIVAGNDNGKTVKQSFKLDQLSFHANNGQLQVSEGMQVRSLSLQVRGNSAIQLDPGSHIDEITGFISDSTKVNANWQTIKTFQSLTDK